MRAVLLTLLIGPLGLVMLLGAGFSSDDEAASAATSIGVDSAALPPLAWQMLPVVQADLQNDCPDLPAVWVLAETQAESSWNPDALSPVGAAGLLQMMPGTWVAAGGPGGGWSGRPPVGHPVWDPVTHLRIAIGWMCANLRIVQADVRATGKPIAILDGVAVCHIAGCARVTGSVSGIPQPGEAGCGSGCVQQITAYLATIHRWVAAFLAAAPPTSGTGTAGTAFTGRSAGCTIPDPSGTGGCVTPAMAWLMTQVHARFGPWPVACWSARDGDPFSDHPKGRACDYTVGRIGTYAPPDLVAHGWQLALWLRANAAALHVAYVIWQGRIWSVRHDPDGWRPYTGGGVYSAAGPTHGHYDHVHVSTTD